jgi:DNA-binding XRE family transcriptional regulator
MMRRFSHDRFSNFRRKLARSQANMAQTSDLKLRTIGDSVE